MVVTAMVYGGVIFSRAIIFGDTAPNPPRVIFLVPFVIGIQLMTLGVIGGIF